MIKIDKLREILKSYQKVAIAYSGGCDSDFLLHVAIDTLGKDNVLAITARGAMLTSVDLSDALKVKDIQHIVCDIDVFEVEEFRNNDPKRCYYCKKNIMGKAIEIAKDHGFYVVCDGKNSDDDKVYRPGNAASKELGIKSPLADCNLSKNEIRSYSKMLGISSYDKPSNACLASRFDYNTKLNEDKLKMVDNAENLIHNLGIRECRVRVLNDLARIEVNQKDKELLFNNQKLINDMKSLGFRFITIDLEGIKSGGYDK